MSLIEENSKKYHVTVSDENKYVYFRIAKAGTRTLIRLLSDHTSVSIGLDPIKYPESKNFGYNIPYNTEWDSYYKFAFVRNPYERLVSCWYSKVIMERYNIGSDPLFDACRGYEFDAFVSYLHNNYKDNLSVNPHVSTQLSLFPSKKVNSILRLENFEECMDKVSSKIGVGNWRRKIKLLNDTQQYREHYTSYYDYNTEQLATELYKTDINVLGYEFD